MEMFFGDFDEEKKKNTTTKMASTSMSVSGDSPQIKMSGMVTQTLGTHRAILY